MAAPKYNLNAEVWTFEEATKLFQKAIGISKDKEDYVIGSGANIKVVKGYCYHFLGEIATQLELYPDLFKYLKNKFSELQPYYKKLKATLEANCFSDSKKGIIKEASAIMNLKSNYGWTDRLDQTTKDQAIENKKIEVVFKDFSDDDE